MKRDTELSVGLPEEKVLPTKKAKQSTTLAIHQSMPKVEEVFPCRWYGSLQKLVRVTAYVPRFISNLKRSLDDKKIAQEDIMQEEYDYSTELWVKEVQKSIRESEQFGQIKVPLSLGMFYVAVEG